MRQEPHPDGTPLVRIGELSRRVGVKPDLLRAWEQRYGVLRPARTPGGFRLYTADDERRVRAMLEHLATGVSAAEAARLATRTVHDGLDGLASAVAAEQELRSALERFDGAAAEAILGALFDRRGVEATMREVIFPCLRNIGEAWACAEWDVAQEHFASELIQRRLTALHQDRDGLPSGPNALLACPPGERHVLGLVGLGVSLRRRGWRVTFLGADTPVGELDDVARLLSSDVIVLAATMSLPLMPIEDQLRHLTADHRVVLAGPGANEERATRVAATYVAGDPVTAAAWLSTQR